MTAGDDRGDGTIMLPPELETIAAGEFQYLREVTTALLHRMTRRMPAEDPQGFAKAVRNGQ